MQPSASREFHTFLGVDLGGGKGKSTAVAVLRRTLEGVKVVFADKRTLSGKLFHDRELIRFISEQASDALLAIDAPLSLTVCLRCLLDKCPGIEQCPDPVTAWYRRQETSTIVSRQGKPALTPYTQRACEIFLHKQFGILPREALGQGMGPLTARAHFLRRALAERFKLNYNLIEVYPRATLQALFDEKAANRYKKEYNTWRTRAQILEALSEELSFEIWRENCLSNDHCFDAVISAYTGYLWAKEGWEMPQNDREIFSADGWIWSPTYKPNI